MSVDVVCQCYASAMSSFPFSANARDFFAGCYDRGPRGHANVSSPGMMVGSRHAGRMLIADGDTVTPIWGWRILTIVLTEEYDRNLKKDMTGDPLELRELSSTLVLCLCQHRDMSAI